MIFFPKEKPLDKNGNLTKTWILWLQNPQFNTITLVGGSIPTSSLSGTLSSSQLPPVGTPGTVGTTSTALTLIIDAYGRITSASANPIAITNTQVSGLGTLSTQNASSVTVGAFGANGTAAQTAYPSGGAITPGAGVFGASSAPNFAALVTLVQNIQAALIANGIMS